MIIDAVIHGKGLYTLQEASLYARLSTVTLSRWLGSTPGKGDRVVRRDGSLNDEKFVTFVDLVQGLAIHEMRTKYKISLQKIREAVQLATSKYDMQYPLAKRHQTFLFGKDIFILPPGHENPIKATGKNIGQVAAKKIIEMYMEDLGFDEKGYAASYTPFQMGIILNPKKNFGEPTLESCGIPAYYLYKAVETEGGIQEASEVFGVTKEEVKRALRFYDILEGRPEAA